MDKAMPSKYVLFLLIGCLIAIPQMAGTANAATTADLLAEGRARLLGHGNPAYDDIAQARDLFAGVIAAQDATDTQRNEARFFHAVAVLAAFGLESGGQDATAFTTLRDVIEAFGYQRSTAAGPGGGDPFDPPASGTVADTVPDGETLRAFLADKGIAMLTTALDDLAALPAGFNLVLDAGETGSWHQTEIDRADILFLRAGLTLARSVVRTVTAYRWDCDLKAVLRKGFQGMFDLQRDILDANPDFASLDGQGAAALAAARQDFLDTITLFAQGLDALNGETDDQNDDLLTMGAQSRPGATEFRQRLDGLKAAMENGQPYEFPLARQESWRIQTDAGDLELRLNFDEAGGLDGGWITNSTRQDVPSGKIYVSPWTPGRWTRTDSRLDAWLPLGWQWSPSYGACTSTMGLSGTSADGTTYTGQLGGTDCANTTGPAPRAGTFTATRESVKEVTAHLDLNRLFGTDTIAPLDIRSALPVFHKGRPVAEATPTPFLNGILGPDLDATGLEDLLRQQERLLSPDGSFGNVGASPFVHAVQEAAIRVDGRADDWTGVPPLALFTAGPVLAVKMARDADSLYVLIQHDGTLADLEAGVGLLPSGPFYPFTPHLGASFQRARGYKAEFWPRGSWGNEETLAQAGSATAGPEAFEFRIPLAVLTGKLGEGPYRVAPSLWQPGGTALYGSLWGLLPLIDPTAPYAPPDTTVLRGFVTSDVVGYEAGVRGAKIVARNTKDGTEYTAWTTGTTGAWSLAVPNGDYDITIVAPGHKSVTIPGQHLTGGLVTVTQGTALQAGGVLGDVNGNGVVDIGDIIILLQELLNPQNSGTN